MQLFNDLIYLITFGASIFFALFVYLKNRKSPVNIYFSIYSFSIIGWLASLFFFYRAEASNVLLIGRLNFAATEIIAFFGFYLGYHFPACSYRFSRKIHIMLSLWLLVLVGLTIGTNLIDQGEIIGKDDIETIFGRFYFIFIIHFLLFISGIFILPLLKYKKANHQRRMQIKYLALGTSLSIIFAGTTNILLPFAFNIYDLQAIGPLGLLPFFGFTSYAIIRHSLLDIKIVIQRGIIYSFLLAILTGVYVVMIFLLGFFFQYSTDAAIILAAGISTVLGIYGAPRLERYFQKKTDKIFFKDKYDYRQAMYELSEVLNRELEMNRLLRAFTGRLKEIIKVEYVNLLLVNENLVCDSGELKRTDGKISDNLKKIIEERGEIMLIHDEIPDIKRNLRLTDRSEGLIKALDEAENLGKRFRIAASVAILSNKRLIGLLNMGKKMSGDYFNQDDINLLKTMSYQIAVALEKARLYEAVKEYSQGLEKKVEQRTAELMGLQMEQKKIMEEMAHGLQTPITILKGEIGEISPQIRDHKKIRHIERSLDRVSKFIYDLLRLSRLESGGREDAREKFDLSELTKELVESYEIIAAEQQVITKSRIEDKLVIWGKRSSVEEMVNNLVSNSMKYLKNTGEKAIEIRLYHAKKEKAAILEVSDNGIGIPRQELPRMFERFHRIRNGNGQSERGTGLGLAICKEIAVKHGGSIAVDSHEGEYTKFRVKLPLA